jgi:hypothetical protein
MLSRACRLKLVQFTSSERFWQTIDCFTSRFQRQTEHFLAEHAQDANSEMELREAQDFVFCMFQTQKKERFLHVASSGNRR